MALAAEAVEGATNGAAGCMTGGVALDGGPIGSIAGPAGGVGVAATAAEDAAGGAAGGVAGGTALADTDEGDPAGCQGDSAAMGAGGTIGTAADTGIDEAVFDDDPPQTGTTRR